MSVCVYEVSTNVDAERVEAVLEAIGLAPVRHFEQNGDERLEWIRDRFTRRFNVSARAGTVLVQLLALRRAKVVGVFIPSPRPWAVTCAVAIGQRTGMEIDAVEASLAELLRAAECKDVEQLLEAANAIATWGQS